VKILSLETNKHGINYSIKKDLLIPCRLYKVSIETPREKKLNFLEETILKLINIDDELLTDIDKLTLMLGFDNTAVVELALKRLKALKLTFDDIEISQNEVKVYTFYQESYTGELLPIMTLKNHEYSYPEKNSKYKEDYYRTITFKKDIHSSKKSEAILIDRYLEYPSKPTYEDIIKTIYLHNKNDYKHYARVDYTNFNIDIVNTNEVIFLHVKLFIPNSSIDNFIISNGFTNDYSTLLRQLYENNHQDLISYFRKELKQDVETEKTEVKIPFDDRISHYADVEKNIRICEENYVKMQDLSSKNQMKHYKEVMLKGLYDGIENAFSTLVESLENTNGIRKKRVIMRRAIDAGFNLDMAKDMLPIFKVSKKDNLQKYLAKALLHKKNELYEIALNFPNFLYTLNNLFKLRNPLKHIDKEEAISKLDEKVLEKYRDEIYMVISMLLRIKQKKTDNEVSHDDDLYFQNSYIDLEEELSIDILKKLPQEIQDNLVSVNYYLNELDFEDNKFAVVKESVNLLSSTFEYFFRDLIGLIILDIEPIKSKDDILDYIKQRCEVELDESLYTVSPTNIEAAQKKNSASLGAYFLVYLSYQDEIDTKIVEIIQNILEGRKHGNPSMEVVEKTTLEELKKLKIDSFQLIKRLVEEL